MTHVIMYITPSANEKAASFGKPSGQIVRIQAESGHGDDLRTAFVEIQISE
jgi:hypothetical protein